MTISYKDAGVDIDAGEELVRRIKSRIRATFNKNVLTDIGLFGGFYRAAFKGMKDPVLVSSVDGVGTKLKVAIAMNQHETVGQDLVNHCVNDILACGARPLFFLDYYATGKLIPYVGEHVVSGFAKACKENGCALIGGETAEMPGMYQEDEYDLAGTVIGVVDRHRIVDGKRIRHGDVLVGLPSSGLHTNGYSLARKVLLTKYGVYDRPEGFDAPLGTILLTVHRSYFKTVYPLLSSLTVKGISHITGGGIEGNTRRILPKGYELAVDWSAWDRPRIFRLIQDEGDVPEDEMRRTFNLGVGMILVVAEKDLRRVMKALKARREKPFVMGRIQKARSATGKKKMRGTP